MAQKPADRWPLEPRDAEPGGFTRGGGPNRAWSATTADEGATDQNTLSVAARHGRDGGHDTSTSGSELRLRSVAQLAKRQADSPPGIESIWSRSAVDDVQRLVPRRRRSPRSKSAVEPCGSGVPTVEAGRR